MTATPEVVSSTSLPRQRADVSGFDFVAVDVETWNRHPGSVCAVGLAVVRGGVVVDEYEALCRPAASFGEPDFRHMAVNKLQLGDLYRAAAFDEVFATVSAFVADLPVVAHRAVKHNAHLARACEVSGLDAPTWEWHCTEAIAREVLDLPSSALADVAAALALPRFRRHEAVADARATAGVLLGLARQTGAVRLAHLPR